MDLMIDIETVGTGPEACILTIAAQAFDPFARGYYNQHYYARIDIESQEGRNIEQGTIDWWATQPPAAREEAFAEENRISLKQSLEELGRLVWHSKRIWANGPTFDMNILEHAYKSYNIPLPWKFYVVRDARTVYGLCPGLNKYPASHHALEDCRRQIDLLHDSLETLNIKELA
jgi:3' exoribonuclease, RNase T-like